MILYQMSVSHYCEKARWALAYKRLPCKTKTMLPGLHYGPAKRLTGQTSLPILKDRKNIVHNSSDIITYLDNEYPRFPLTPEDEDLARDAAEWEEYADTNIGPQTRLLAYSILLDRPDVLLPMFAYDGPWYKSFVLKKAFPKIKAGLTKALPITENSVEQARQELHKAMERVLSKLKGSNYLVGERFSRADLSVAALFAPLFQPGKYPMAWPLSNPLELQALEKEFSAIQPWLINLYDAHR